MYSTEATNKYAELLKTATETLAPLFSVDVDATEAPASKEAENGSTSKD